MFYQYHKAYVGVMSRSLAEFIRVSELNQCLMMRGGLTRGSLLVCEECGRI